MINLNPRPYDPLLLVEGLDDKHVIRHLAERWNEDLEFAIKDYEGIENILPNIRDHIDEPGRPAIGIVVDADTNPSNTWRRIWDRIRDAGRTISPIPPTSDSNGTIIPENPITDSPRIGVWIMPDNSNPGELEDFVEMMIPVGDPVWPLSQQYIAGIPSTARKFADGKTTRAQIHAWLATREDPRQMGLAITARDLETNGPLCQRFVAWLNRLFG